MTVIWNNLVLVKTVRDILTAHFVCSVNKKIISDWGFYSSTIIDSGPRD